MDMDKRTERWAVYLGRFLLLFAAGQPSDAAIIWRRFRLEQRSSGRCPGKLYRGHGTQVSVVLVDLELNQTSAEQLVTGISSRWARMASTPGRALTSTPACWGRPGRRSPCWAQHQRAR